MKIIKGVNSVKNYIISKSEITALRELLKGLLTIFQDPTFDFAFSQRTYRNKFKDHNPVKNVNNIEKTVVLFIVINHLFCL